MSNQITYTPCLKKKFAKDKSGIINIRITEDRRSKYISLKKPLEEKYWNKKRCEVKNTCEGSDELNSLIRDKIDQLKDDPKTIKKEEKETNEGVSFIKFFNNQLEHLILRQKMGTYKSQKSSYFHLINFLQSKSRTELLFSEIDPLFIRDFETYLINKGLNSNSRIKYLKTIKNIYNLAIKSNTYLSTINPFSLIDNKYSKVTKETLDRKHVEKIIGTQINESNPLYTIKNQFLFQIFAQGLRVSDLMTLRWGNLVTGEINFTQFKTKSPHQIPLNSIIVFKLREYLPLKCAKVYNLRYKFIVDGTNYSMNYDEISDYYNKFSKENISKFISGDKQTIILIEKWLGRLNEIKEKQKMRLILEIIDYAKKHPTNFIFPFLKDEDYEDIIFNKETLLSKFQYNQMSSKTTYYNKQLKKLQEKCGIEITLTSHLSRHTYTSLMIEVTDKDIYTISKSLGHNSLSVTEQYVNEFLTTRVTDQNSKLDDSFKTN
jgi:site-specific recombinase XerD